MYGYSIRVFTLLLVSQVLVGPPPEQVGDGRPHTIDEIVVITGLNPTTTDSDLKRFCIENIGRPRFIYMHVNDVISGYFSGTAVIEFLDSAAARKSIENGILKCSVRLVNKSEFQSLTESDWPMLEYGPPRGVFNPTTSPPPQPVAPPGSWGASWASRPAPSNPWQN